MKRFFTICFFILSSLFCTAQLNAEQKNIQQLFFSFLKFYQKNEKKFNSFELYKGKGKENGPPYKIQWKEAERYFAYLRKYVPYVGEAYIKAEREHFKNAEKNFKEYPEEEIVMGFDYDRWAGGQESISYTYKWYTSPQNKYIVTISGDKAFLKIGGELWEGATENDRAWSIVPFVKEKGKWKMADNVYPADIEEIEKIK
ncbi:hypothetical protein LK994_03915 [Ferruginibacter lapsinanis]|uniref:hypothetical protein n=1 Tax=Ferruginibacter lapsinanis TaxID=563172 RepID=UPI001E64D711|nr:hypothetical protein [Ferruginibacter lapsinanis]UEG50616.1 hypothetical protein LK994_03915 [Ferruginibacter lapsinanis]